MHGFAAYPPASADEISLPFSGKGDRLRWMRFPTREVYIHFSKTKKFKIFIYAAAPRILRFGRRLGKTPAVIESARLCHNCSVRNFPLSCSLGHPTRTLCISPFTPSILRYAVLPDCSVRLIASFA